MKFSFVWGILHGSPQTKAKLDYPSAMTTKHIVCRVLLGLLGFLIWILACDILMYSIPKIEIIDLYGPFSLTAGLWLSNLIEI